MIWFALLLLIVGVPGALFPYRLSLFSERLDAIGSKTRMSEVEPADWKVLVARIFGVGFSLVGLFLTFLWVAPRL